MPTKRWLYSFAPVTTITFAAILAVSLAVGSAMLALSGPWLGAVFDRSYDGAGVRVSQVLDNSPAAGKLREGDIIRAFSTPSHGRVEIKSYITLDDPDQLSSYAEYNSFFAHQQAVYEAFASPVLTAILSDERQVEISPAAYPGPTILPGAFWALLLLGGTSFLLGVSVWSMRRSEPVTRVLALSGMGFMLGAYACAIYISRELALPSNLFFALASVNHLGIMVFAYSTSLFLWFYPTRLGNGPAAWVFVLGIAAIWLNETLQWLSWPAHAFYAHFVLAYFLLVFFTYLQWRKSRRAPLDRVMLKWLLLTILLSMGFTIVFFYAPIILTGKPIASMVLTFASVFALYLGLIIGSIRYQQFDMEHWWVRAWQWLIFIFVALAADVLFVYFLNLKNTTSGGLAVVVGVVYLLARQWLWGRFAGGNRRAMDRALPHLVEALVSQQQKVAPEQQWRQLIERVFNPLTLKTIPDQRSTAYIEQSGLALQFPSLDGLTTMEAFCCDQGKRLFAAADVNLVNRLLELMRHSRDLFVAHEQGAQEERHRIQRDLHDDVAARLLSLLHQTREPMISRVASNALRGLRDVIHLLGAEEAALEDVMTDIEAGAREQLAGLGVRFEWHAPDKWPDTLLSSQQHINLRRIARETIANALKHAHPSAIIMQAELDANELCLRIHNDSTDSLPSSWVPGRGLNNIKSRVAEVGGSHEWGIEHRADNKRYCYLAVRIPLHPGEKLEPHTTD